MITDSFPIVGRPRTSDATKELKTSWTSDQDATLLAAVNRFGPSKWAVIASNVHGRNAKQCRDRWSNHVNPEINKNPWTESEDDFIMYSYHTIGTKWSAIAKKMNGRTDNGVKNRFEVIKNNRSNNNTWTETEDDLLMRSYNRIGMKWSAIAKQIDGRTGNAARNRFKVIKDNHKLMDGIAECTAFEAYVQECEDDDAELIGCDYSMIDGVADDLFLNCASDMQQCTSIEDIDLVKETCEGGGSALDLDKLFGNVPPAVDSRPLTPTTPIVNNVDVDLTSIESLSDKSEVDARKPDVYFVTQQPTAPCTIRKAVRIRMRPYVHQRPLKEDTRKPGVYFVTQQPTAPCTIRKAVRIRMRSDVCDRPLNLRFNPF